MYDYISGKLVEKSPTRVVIDNHGIGYVVNISLNTFGKIKDEEAVKLFVHFMVREDAHTFYGFADDNERKLFRALISVSGVGANTARLVLSSLSTDEAFSAITGGNTNVLQSVKGIGGKTAQRIVVDLKDKLLKAGITGDKVDFSHNTLKDEALSGLLILGFNKSVSSKAIDKIMRQTDVQNVEALIKEALKIL